MMRIVSTVRLLLFVTAAVLGAITVVWAQTSGGMVADATETADNLTTIYGAAALIFGLALAYGEMRWRLGAVEALADDNCRRQEAHEDAVDRRLDALETKRDEQHHELMDEIRRLRR